ncbi:hypothetical protein [Helicobacter macacae]|uniref:hypothetical protein n=1 Tax=Helicobacter macacae TaxID=398626 RepID=UPI0011DCFE90|nr:hypothetical protein [Helicobacter macacae]
MGIFCIGKSVERFVITKETTVSPCFLKKLHFVRFVTQVLRLARNEGKEPTPFIPLRRGRGDSLIASPLAREGGKESDNSAEGGETPTTKTPHK